MSVYRTWKEVLVCRSVWEAQARLWTLAPGRCSENQQDPEISRLPETEGAPAGRLLQRCSGGLLGAGPWRGNLHIPKLTVQAAQGEGPRALCCPCSTGRWAGTGHGGLGVCNAKGPSPSCPLQSSVL